MQAFEGISLIVQDFLTNIMCNCFLAAQNNLFGKIPTEIGKLTAMEKLYLSTNNFDGKIPTEIDQLTKLKTLNLEGNKLTGDLDQLCSDTETGRITKHDVFVSDCNRNKLKCSCCDCFD